MDMYRASIVGCGPRGEYHAEGFIANNDRFILTACCDIDAERASGFAQRFEVPKTYSTAEQMLDAERPDVLCFATMPSIRLSLVELGVKYGVKAIAMEKPMATDLLEARQIRDLCNENGIKLIVSHQQKYGPHWQAVKRIVDQGEIGEIHTIHATSQGWLLQLGTHLMAYMSWFNGNHPIEWVVGHVQGKGKLNDSHPSPDYAFGQVAFTNGVRGIIECGTLAPHQPGDNSFWLDNGVTIYGTHGYARVITGGGWQAITRHSNGAMLSGPGTFDPSFEQPIYLKELADWLDNPSKVHSCNADDAYHGFEAVMAICISAMEHQKIALPLGEIPETPIFMSLANHLS